MGGMLDSMGGFLGLSDGPQAPAGKFYNPSLNQANLQNQMYGTAGATNTLADYGQGKISSEDAMSSAMGGLDPNYMAEFQNALAAGATTGSKYATEQVQKNPILGGLYGQGGQLGQAEDKLTGLQNQGFELKPEDQSLYGQMSGNIARQFGQQGNQAANDLASRGLSSSGAAGAAFSGLAGNQNEQLAQAQQQIAQQRFQNTQQQIGQYQNFINSMGANANNAIGQQYGRQLQGAEDQRNALLAPSGGNAASNNAENSYGMQSAAFNAANKPKNAMDFFTSGMGQGLQAQGSGAMNPTGSTSPLSGAVNMAGKAAPMAAGA